MREEKKSRKEQLEETGPKVFQANSASSSSIQLLEGMGGGLVVGFQGINRLGRCANDSSLSFSLAHLCTWTCAFGARIFLVRCSLLSALPLCAQKK